MHIPMKVDYGVRALVHLAIYGKEKPVRASEIAKTTSIPEAYLAQLLHEFSKNGVVRSTRGPHGGHLLAMDPSEIKLSLVMESLGSREQPVSCLEDVSSCVHFPGCAQREVWQNIAAAVSNILESTTIKDLASNTPVTTLV